MKLFRVGLVLSLGMLLMTGCGSAAEEPMQTDTPSSPTPSAAAQPKANTASASAPTMMQDMDITLSVVETNPGQVTFAWELADGVEQPEKFRLVRSMEENPEHNGKNYWFQVHGTNRAIIWTEFPTGPQHVRLCTYDTEEQTCMTYSNDVLVNLSE